MTARELKRRLITMFSVESEESDVDRRKLRCRRHWIGFCVWVRRRSMPSTCRIGRASRFVARAVARVVARGDDDFGIVSLGAKQGRVVLGAIAFAVAAKFFAEGRLRRIEWRRRGRQRRGIRRGKQRVVLKEIHDLSSHCFYRLHEKFLPDGRVGPGKDCAEAMAMRALDVGEAGPGKGCVDAMAIRALVDAMAIRALGGDSVDRLLKKVDVVEVR
jgi:hypothetical protein